MRFVNHRGEDFLVAHFQGWSLKRNPVAATTFMAAKIGVPAGITIVTFATADILADAALPRQLDAAGVAYLNPALDVVPWRNPLKITLLLETLPAVRTEYVLALDGRDVLLCGPLDTIVARLASYPGIDVLFGAQKTPFPPVPIEDIASRQELGPFAHLNAGTMFGKTDAVDRFYRHAAAIDEPTYSEQFLVRIAFAEHSDGVWFDHRCRIFQYFGTRAEIVEDDGTFMVR
ncbi:MAG: hypothetical protein C5B60_02565 [Chloroflexi bacterium]|nr:MAG: hypothetical protein C5B60_02565 [Chloroflexota bacterium]